MLAPGEGGSELECVSCTQRIFFQASQSQVSDLVVRKHLSPAEAYAAQSRNGNLFFAIANLLASVQTANGSIDFHGARPPHDREKCSQKGACSRAGQNINTHWN